MLTIQIAYGEDSDTLGDGVGLLHEVGNTGHDCGAVVAGPVPEHALHLESNVVSLFDVILVEFDKM